MVNTTAQVIRNQEFDIRFERRYISKNIEMYAMLVAVDHNKLATMCNAMGDPTRVRIVQFLLSCCCPVAVEEDGDVRPFDGATAGQVCCHLCGEEKISSTVSFHLKVLRDAEIIRMEKRGKYMISSVNREALAMLATFFANATGTGTQCSGD